MGLCGRATGDGGAYCSICGGLPCLGAEEGQVLAGHVARAHHPQPCRRLAGGPAAGGLLPLQADPDSLLLPALCRALARVKGRAVFDL